MMGCSDTNESQSKKGKWSQADMDKCVSQMQESAGKFDWDEVGVDFDTKKWATCVCKKAEKEWESFDMMDRKEKDAELNKEKETKMREIFESCREDNFSKKEYSNADIEELKRTSKLSKTEIKFYLDFDLDNTIPSSEITDVNGVSVIFTHDATEKKLYKDGELFDGYFYEEVYNLMAYGNWYCNEPYNCKSERGYHSNIGNCIVQSSGQFYSISKCSNGDVVKRVSINRKIIGYREETDTILRIRSSFNYRLGKEHGRRDHYDKDGSIANMRLMINGEENDCIGVLCN